MGFRGGNKSNTSRSWTKMEDVDSDKETAPAAEDDNMPAKSSGSCSTQEEMAVGRQQAPEMGSDLPTLNPLATSFTPHSQAATVSPASYSRPTSPHRRSTPPSLERFTQDFRELKASLSSPSSSNNNNNNNHNNYDTLPTKIARLAQVHDQRRQLLSHMGTAKTEIDALLVKTGGERLRIKEGGDALEQRVKELEGLREWVGEKWVGLGEEVGELEAEIAVPGRKGEGEGEGGEFWGL